MTHDSTAGAGDQASPPLSEPLILRAGEVLFREGDDGRKAYGLIAGVLGVSGFRNTEYDKWQAIAATGHEADLESLRAWWQESMKQTLPVSQAGASR